MKSLTFKGGVHPEYFKEATSGDWETVLAVPKELINPLSQHIGAPAIPCVAVGDEVKMGETIADPGGYVSTTIHATVSGKVTAIEPRPGPMGIDIPSIMIENDGLDTPIDYECIKDWQTASADTLRDYILTAGIVGMGGAAFPTQVKLAPPANKKIDTLILNGAECEPYLTADHRIMIEKSFDVVEGALIAQKILKAKRVIIAIEENKPDAILEIEKACKGKNVEICVLKVKYPQGAEKQIIDACIGREVPSGGLPMDVGTVVQNVGTCSAIYNGIVNGKPLIDHIVTVAGGAIGKPTDLLIRLGTPISYAIEACDVSWESAGKVILGGPMMGFAQHGVDVPVVKNTSGILVFANDQVDALKSKPCIRCGRCLNACPMRLVPADISRYTAKKMFEDAKNVDAQDCMECGSCAHECPSKLPLVQNIRLAKAHIMQQRRKENKN